MANNPTLTNTHTKTPSGERRRTPQEEYLWRISSYEATDLDLDKPTPDVTEILRMPKHGFDPHGEIIFNKVVPELTVELVSAMGKLSQETPGFLLDLAKDVTGLGLKTPEYALPEGFTPATSEQKRVVEKQKDKRNFSWIRSKQQHTQEQQQETRQEDKAKQKVRLLGKYISTPISYLKQLLGINPTHQQELTAHQMVEAYTEMKKQEDNADAAENRQKEEAVKPKGPTFDRNKQSELGPTSIYSTPG